METETTTWSEFPDGGKTVVEQILASEERNPKEQDYEITVWDPSRKVNYLSKVIWDGKIITQFTRSISSTKISKPVPMMDFKVSKDKNISRWLIESTWSKKCHLEKCDLFSDVHYRFRSSRSTADLLTVVSDRIASAFKKSGAIPAVALDIWQGLAC